MSEKKDIPSTVNEKVMVPDTLFDEPVAVLAEETTTGTKLYFDTVAFGG